MRRVRERSGETHKKGERERSGETHEKGEREKSRIKKIYILTA